MKISVCQKNWVFGYSWSTLLWYRCYYPHQSRDALSPVCGIFVCVFCTFSFKPILHLVLRSRPCICYITILVTPQPPLHLLRDVARRCLLRQVSNPHGPFLLHILRFFLPCKSDCQPIFLKKQGIFSLYAKL